MFCAEQRATHSLKEMQTASQAAAFDICPAQSEVQRRQQENPHLLVTSGCWAQDLLRETKGFAGESVIICYDF